MKKQTSVRETLTRSVAGILAALGTWAIGRGPAAFLESIGGWVNIIGTVGVLLALGVYATVGLKPANRILSLLSGHPVDELEASPELPPTPLDNAQRDKALPRDDPERL